MPSSWMVGIKGQTIALNIVDDRTSVAIRHDKVSIIAVSIQKKSLIRWGLRLTMVLFSAALLMQTRANPYTQ